MFSFFNSDLLRQFKALSSSQNSKIPYNKLTQKRFIKIIDPIIDEYLINNKFEKHKQALKTINMENTDEETIMNSYLDLSDIIQSKICILQIFKQFFPTLTHEDFFNKSICKDCPAPEDTSTECYRPCLTFYELPFLKFIIKTNIILDIYYNCATCLDMLKPPVNIRYNDNELYSKSFTDMSNVIKNEIENIPFNVTDFSIEYPDSSFMYNSIKPFYDACYSNIHQVVIKKKAASSSNNDLNIQTKESNQSTNLYNILIKNLLKTADEDKATRRGSSNTMIISNNPYFCISFNLFNNLNPIAKNIIDTETRFSNTLNNELSKKTYCKYFVKNNSIKNIPNSKRKLIKPNRMAYEYYVLNKKTKTIKKKLKHPYYDLYPPFETDEHNEIFPNLQNELNKTRSYIKDTVRFTPQKAQLLFPASFKSSKDYLYNYYLLERSTGLSFYSAMSKYLAKNTRYEDQVIKYSYIPQYSGYLFKSSKKMPHYYYKVKPLPTIFPFGHHLITIVCCKILDLNNYSLPINYRSLTSIISNFLAHFYDSTNPSLNLYNECLDDCLLKLVNTALFNKFSKENIISFLENMVSLTTTFLQNDPATKLFFNHYKEQLANISTFSSNSKPFKYFNLLQSSALIEQLQFIDKLEKAPMIHVDPTVTFYNTFPSK